MSRIVPALAGFVALVLLAPARSQAGELEDKMKTLAGQVAGLVKEKKQKAVALGEITPLVAGLSNSGPGFQKLLVAELAKQKVTIDEESELVVTGKYLSADGEDKHGKSDDELITLRLILTILDRRAKQQGEFSAILPTAKPGVNEEIAKRLPVQTELGKHKKATEDEANKKIKLDQKKPPLHLDDCDVKTTKESPFAVTVLVRGKGQKDFVAAKPTDKNDKGRAFVQMKDGDTYRLVLSNTSAIEAVATVLIDGIDVTEDFVPADERPLGFLIRKQSKRTVSGWLKGKEGSTAFLVGKFSDSKSAKLLRGSASLGTIVVCFHHCWEGETVPPEYQGGRSANRLGTGEGEEIKEKSNVVKRTIGPLQTSIVIRYDK